MQYSAVSSSSASSTVLTATRGGETGSARVRLRLEGGSGCVRDEVEQVAFLVEAEDFLLLLVLIKAEPSFFDDKLAELVFFFLAMGCDTAASLSGCTTDSSVDENVSAAKGSSWVVGMTSSVDATWSISVFTMSALASAAAVNDDGSCGPIASS